MVFFGLAVAFVLIVASRRQVVQAQAKPVSFALVPGATGGQDLFGAYDVVRQDTFWLDKT